MAGERFALEGQRQPQPEVHLRADEAVPYRVVAQTLADAARAGLSKIGFVSAPQAALSRQPSIGAASDNCRSRRQRPDFRIAP